jgi:hypothetical protein
MDDELTDDDVRVLKRMAEAAREQWPDRRAMLKAASVGAVGFGIGSAATGTALAQPTGDEGQVGTQANPVEVWASEIDASEVTTDEVNRTYRVQPSDDLASVVSGLTQGDTLIIDTEDGTRAHSVSSTLTFNAAVTIVFRGYVKPGGDFTAIELNNATGTYRIIPMGEGYVVKDDDGNSTSATSHGVETHNGYSVKATGRVNGVGGVGVYHHQASTGDKLNHCGCDWIIGNTGSHGFKNENTSGESANVQGHYGRIHVFDPGDNAVEFVDGGRNLLHIVGANGGAGQNALNEQSGAGGGLYWLEEEGYGNVSSVQPDSRLWVVSSDKVGRGGYYSGNPRKAVSFAGSDQILPVEENYEFHVDSGSTHTWTLPSDAPQGTEVVIKDLDGAAGTNTQTIDTEGSANIDGSSSITITTDYGYRRLLKAGSGSGGVWVVVGSN